MLHRPKEFLLLCLCLTWLMACTPAFSSAPTVPTLDPGEINRIVAQTAEAASTQTAGVIATPLPVETATPIARLTQTPKPTFTKTFSPLDHSPTAFVLPSLTPTSSSGRQEYDCRVLDAPPDGTIYNPRVEFKARWRLRNTGRTAWDGIGVDFVYDFGDRFHITAAYDLQKTVEIGDAVEFVVDMLAPKDPGVYTTHWALKIGEKKFCKVSLTINVKE